MQPINSAWLVDDDPIFVFALSKLLKRIDIFGDVRVFENGKMAMDALQENPVNAPDVIFLDLNMPIMDGWQFLEEMDKAEAVYDVTILVLSSTVDPEDLNRLSKHQTITKFIPKPVTLSKLQEVFSF